MRCHLSRLSYITILEIHLAKENPRPLLKVLARIRFLTHAQKQRNAEKYTSHWVNFITHIEADNNGSANQSLHYP